jgi:soluble lytic murein transglycosylase-like protein
MINRFTGTGAKLVQLASQPITGTSVMKTARGLLTTAQHTLTVFGLSAVAVIALLYARPELAKQVSDLLYPQPAASNEAMALVANTDADAKLAEADAKDNGAADKAAPAHKAAPASTRQQQNVTSWLSKKYRVAGDATNMLVSTAYTTAHEIKLDPLLILAVMAIESGLNPFAESPVGAKGLMQVMAKVHHEKFREVGGAQAALNPVANIRVGAQILKEYVTRGGSVEAGLKTYVGAGAFDTDSGYGSRVLAEYRRLKQVAVGKDVPTYSAPAPAPIVAKAAPAPAPSAPAKAEPEAASASASESHASEAIAGL